MSPRAFLMIAIGVSLAGCGGAARTLARPRADTRRARLLGREMRVGRVGAESVVQQRRRRVEQGAAIGFEEERLVPEEAVEASLQEHLARYRFALRVVDPRRQPGANTRTVRKRDHVVVFRLPA